MVLYHNYVWCPSPDLCMGCSPGAPRKEEPPLSIRHHITVNKNVLSVLIKHFLPLFCRPCSPTWLKDCSQGAPRKEEPPLSIRHHITVNKNVLSVLVKHFLPLFCRPCSPTWLKDCSQGAPRKEEPPLSIRHHITVNKNVLSVLIKHFLPLFRRPCSPTWLEDGLRWHCAQQPSGHKTLHGPRSSRRIDQHESLRIIQTSRRIFVRPRSVGNCQAL